MHATAGQAVVQTLERFGVDRVFGIPGVHTLDIYNALYGFSIEHITRVHEGSIMRTATAMARVTRVPAVAIVSAGLGAINSVVGVGEARALGVPLVSHVCRIRREPWRDRVLSRHGRRPDRSNLRGTQLQWLLYRVGSDRTGHPT